MFSGGLIKPLLSKGKKWFWWFVHSGHWTDHCFSKKKLWSTLCYLNIWYQIGHGQKKKINHCMLNRIFFDENQFTNCKSMKVVLFFWKVHKSYDCVAECMHLFLFSPKRDTRFFASSISSCCMYWEENVEKWSNTP